MIEILYFAYGSNMLTRWLRTRVPSARHYGVGYVEKHRLTFDKVSITRSGKCDCEESGNPNDRVHGVIFSVSVREKRALDCAEGLGKGYDEKIVSVITDGSMIDANTYYATNKDRNLLPYDWYKELVQAGACEHNLPKEYIAEFIDSVAAQVDSDKERTEEARTILNAAP